MKKTLPLVLAALMAAVSCHSPQAYSPVDYVNPLVGTLSKPSLSAGNTYPAIARPWGTHAWTPQTGANRDGWIYTYTADKICGFRQTHQPSPWMNDYGSFCLMPVTTGPVTDPEARASWFSHKAEQAKPYLYSVYLADHDATVELTPTERAALMRITYPERELSYLVVDAWKGGGLSVEGRTITGWVSRNSGGVAENFRNWFVIESDTDFSVSAIEEDRVLVGFPTARGQQVQLRIASSFIGPDQARLNLQELGDGCFERICQEGRDRWNEVLSRIEVEDDNTDRLRTFYSCLYRCVLFPRDFSEVNAQGKRVHYSPHDGKVHEGYLFTDTGLWDTFRSLFALVDWIYPEQAAKMMEGFQNHYLESGYLPEWSSPGHRDCMVGANSASVIAEACLKGIGGADYKLLWEALDKGAHSHLEGTSSGRVGHAWYDSLGYIPCDVGIRESAARTLEYAYDDWCIWRMGQALGLPEERIGPYKTASGNYRNLYRSGDGLMGGRRQDGSFPEDFNPFKWGGDFTEGNAFHYSWSVFHEPDSLMALMGGASAFEKGLDRIFEVPPIFDDSYYGRTIHEIREMQIMGMGNYAHGNQPIQHVLYLYDWCGRPDKTQARVREVMDRFYACTPDGYCGDEDNGQTSAWYVFSALGFYPVCPASCEYALGTPLFGKATVRVPGRAPFTVTASGGAGPLVRSVSLRHRPLSRPFLSHEDLVSGGRLSFELQ